MDQDLPDPPILARPVEPALARPRSHGWWCTGLDPAQISPRDALLDFGLLLIAGVLVHYLPPLLIYIATGDAFSGMEARGGGAGGDTAVLITGKWLELFLIASFAMYFVIRNGLTLRNLGLRGDKPERQVGWAVLTLIGSYTYLIGSAVVFIAWMMMNGVVESEAKQRLEFMKQLPIDNVGQTAMLLVAVAIHEELLFRGLMLPLLKRATGNWWSAVLISSAIFGTLHFTQGWMAMVQITGLAVVLSIFFLASRSLVAVVIAHFCFDFLQIQLMRLIQQFGPEVLPVSTLPGSHF